MRTQAVSVMIMQGKADYLIEARPTGILAGPISQIKQTMGYTRAARM